MARPTLHDVHPNNQALLNISVGYKNEEYIADRIFPRVQVQKKSDFYFEFPPGAWYRNRSGPRAPGARAPRGDYDLTTASYLCVNDSLAKGVPDETRDNADAPLQPDIEAVEYVTDGLLLAQEIRVADLTTGGSATWGYAATPGTQWTSDVSDPFGDIQDARNGVVSTIGRMPNKMVMSWDVWRELENHPDFLDRVKYTRQGAVLTPADLQAWFNLTEVLIGYGLKDIAQEGITASVQYIWGDQVWLGYVPPNPALRTPAAGYVLQWGTYELNRFREDQEHQDVVEVQWFTTEKVTASDAGAVIYNVV